MSNAKVRQVDFEYSVIVEYNPTGTMTHKVRAESMAGALRIVSSMGAAHLEKVLAISIRQD